MNDVFLSYVEEDAQVAVAIATGLEQAGYTTWCYTRNSLPVIPYLTQVLKAIEQAQAIVLLVSPDSVKKSNQVNIEVVRGLESRKQFIPILLNIRWDEFKKQQPEWALAMGGAVGVPATPETVPQLIPRLVAGMTANGLPPKARETFSRIVDRYPFPLAAVYARRMIAGAEAGQAFQLHEGLRDIATAVIRYVAAVAVAHYRQACRGGAAPDTFAEDELRQLAGPQPGTWVALAHSALGLYPKTAEVGINELYEFFFDKKHREDAVARAAGELQGWLGQAVPRRPPFSGGDFFELLAQYRVHPQGWGTEGAVLSAEDYRRRAGVLAEALEVALGGLEFLTQFPLVGVTPDVGAWAGDKAVLLQAMGRELVPFGGAVRPGKPLPAGHVFLCRVGPGGMEPWLDLFPLMKVGKCRTCDRPAVMALGGGGRGEAVWENPACGHAEAAPADDRRALEAFIANREDRIETDAGPYLAALREVLADGEITDKEREKLEFLAKMLRLTADRTADMERQVRDEMERPIRARLQELLTQPAEPSDAERAVLREIPGALRPTPERLQALEDQVRGEIARYTHAMAAALTAPDGGAADAERLSALAVDAGLTAEQAGRLQERVRREQAARPPVDVPEDASPPAAEALAAAPLERTWRQESAAPVLGVAAFGEPVRILSAAADGEVTVRDGVGRALYSERLGGRPYRVLAARGLALVSTWDGELGGFTERELAWQVRLDSPVAALAATPAGDHLVAGTWEGLLRCLDRTGRTRWTQRLADGVAAIAAAETHVAAATYSGQLVLLDIAGQVTWLREMPAPAAAVQFAAGGAELLLLRRDRILTRLGVADQRVRDEKAYEKPLLAMDLSADGRRLVVVSADGRLRVYALADDLHLRRDHAIDGLAAASFLPLGAEGRFLVAAAADGRLAFADNQANRVTAVAGEPAAGPVRAMAVLPDGRAVACGRDDALECFGLARPRLDVALTPRGTLKKGGFARVELRLTNAGSRAARDIRVAVEGPVDCRPAGLPTELAPGKTAATAEVSLEARAAGALPVTLRVGYRDELELEYEDTSRVVLDAVE